MTRFAWVVVLLLAGPVVWAQDSAPAEAPPAPQEPAKPAEAAPADQDPASQVVGERVEIRTRLDVVLTGMVRSRQFEVQRGSQFIPAESEDQPGAGIRVWYAMGLNGFIFVRNEEVQGIRFLGGMTEAEVKVLVAELEDARIKAEQDRARAAAEMAAKRAAREAAKEEAASEEEPGGEAPDAGKATAKAPAAPLAPSAMDPKRLAKIKELLLRFPPQDWKPTRIEEIKKRIVVLDVFPSEEERAFIENFDLWQEGYRLWQQAQGGAEKGNAPPAEGESPPPEPVSDPGAPRARAYPPPTPPGQPLPREEAPVEPAEPAEDAAPDESPAPADDAGTEEDAPPPAEGE